MTRPVPRVHGNGFLQLDLDEAGDRRLHIWGHPDLPKQVVNTGIHNHIFGVESRILVGHIIDVTWIVVSPAQLHSRTSGLRYFEPYSAQREEGTQNTVLMPDGDRVAAWVHFTQYIGLEGHREYTIPQMSYHSTITDGPAATVMRKVWNNEDRSLRPTVLVPEGQKPDNAFKRDGFDEKLLWKIIEEVYPQWESL